MSIPKDRIPTGQAYVFDRSTLNQRGGGICFQVDQQYLARIVNREDAVTSCTRLSTNRANERTAYPLVPNALTWSQARRCR
jgi:hypothetical protein